jgi:cytochrome c oxidase subunit II
MSASPAQSSLDGAQGSPAALIADLGTTLYAVCGFVLLVVLCLVIAGLVRDARQVDAGRWIVLGGVALPVVVLAGFFIYALLIGTTLHVHGRPEALRVQVEGRQWWWQVRYEQPDSPDAIVLANEIHIPAGRPVELRLTTGDVIHSLWVPALAGKVDMIPGRTNRLVLRADRPGTFRGQCAEYCGGQHAMMALYVVATPEAEFRSWLANQARPARSAGNPELKRGEELFFRGGCGHCHTVRGTGADGTIGPDLTHVGSRRSLAAGIMNNHVGTMAGWIAGSQDLKPGNAMPDTATYTGAELRALAAWLSSLE